MSIYSVFSTALTGDGNKTIRFTSSKPLNISVEKGNGLSVNIQEVK